jgi:D-alanyl-D-alanine carboxypeptidase
VKRIKLKQPKRKFSIRQGRVVFVLLALALIVAYPWSQPEQSGETKEVVTVEVGLNILPSSTPVTTAKPTQIVRAGQMYLSPVSKTWSLPADYAPHTVNTDLPGGWSVTPDTKNHLQSLFSAAERSGIKIQIISGYRSYQNQVYTFNYWVSQEMATGKTREQAEVAANVYSARPGQSEHQLGTTLDLKCVECTDFDNSAGNLAVYEFLRQNGHKYGFVISYPEGKEDLTGYTYEPWHIRYIGIDLATELFNRNYLGNNGEYLEKFLLEKKLY